MASIADLDTPCVVIDIDKVEANLVRAQSYADLHGLPLRPHIKTHKLPSLARRQVELGAIGITCQKIGEAEIMADHGLADIFLPYNIIGTEKLARLVALSHRTRLSVTADSAACVDGLAKAFADQPTPLTVLVECDTGMGRCGVTDHDSLVALARTIDAAPSLVFGGIMTYPAAGTVAATARWLKTAVEVLTQAGLPPAVVSNGGTPDLWQAHTVAAATEHRPGTYIYLDRYQVEKGVGQMADCALTVLATIVSRPTPTRAVVDAGSKALTSDTLGLSGFGHILQAPGAVLRSLSEEHGVIDLAYPEQLKIGDRVSIVPNHACVVSNLVDTVFFVSGDTIVSETPVLARGKLG